MTVGSLPRIVRFLEPVDAPGSQCPHCGAEGRYIERFVVEDGRTLGAMRGWRPCRRLRPSFRVCATRRALSLSWTVQRRSIKQSIGDGEVHG